MYKINNKGQVILFVAATLVIALGLGISVSERTLSSISRVTESDTSSRALAAAEAGAENYLSKDDATLETLASDGTTIDIDLVYPIPGVTSRAKVKVENLSFAAGDTYPIGDLAEMQTHEIKTAGYSGTNMTVCWLKQGNDPDLYYKVISTTPEPASVLRTGYFEENGGSNLSITSVPATFAKTADTDTIAGKDYNCSQNINVNNGEILRIMPFGGTMKTILIRPVGSGNSIPNQGFKITSIGEIVTSDTTPVKRTIEVSRSYSYPAGPVFDFAVYSDKSDVIGQ